MNIKTTMIITKTISGLYHKFFTTVIYNRKGTLQFAAYLTVIIYNPS